MKRKILIVELWGLGDLTFATPVIAAAVAAQEEVHLLGKQHAKLLLEPTFPQVKFIAYEAPWTVYRGKYKLWQWKWREMFALISRLRAEKYDVSVSVRNDPRDQVFMWCVGATRRLGFVLEGARRYMDAGRLFLTRRLKRPTPMQHKVDDWHQIGAALELPDSAGNPKLDHTRYHNDSVDRFFTNATKPVICLHTGARIGVRRWPEQYFVAIIAEMRKRFQFHLIVIPEPQAPSSNLEKIADLFVTNISVGDLVDVLGRADLLLCNDSGPSHVAVSCGRPVIAVFGPSEPRHFRPWGDDNKVIMRDICEWRPCADYCKFSEPHCMTKLLPSIVWPDIEQHILSLVSAGKLPAALLNTPGAAVAGI